MLVEHLINMITGVIKKASCVLGSDDVAGFIQLILGILSISKLFPQAANIFLDNSKGLFDRIVVGANKLVDIRCDSLSSCNFNNLYSNELFTDHDFQLVL